MIAIDKKKLETVIHKYEDEIDLHLLKVKGSLTSWLKKSTVGKGVNIRSLRDEEILYLRLLRLSLPKIIKGNADKLDEYKKYFEKIIPSNQRGTTNFIKFKDALLSKMGYSLLRSGDKKRAIKPFYPKFYADLGIKSCVYCNSQLTICVDKGGNNKSAKFQVDHFEPKADYPFLSISFFNLYPVCGSCNLQKGGSLIDFNLYASNSSQILKSELTFELEKKSLALFRLSRLESKLSINFKGKGSKDFDEAFDVKGIYNTQKDLAAEIVLKSEIYNNSYKKALHNSFKKLYPDERIPFNRFIVGNYTDPKDIHKRPMAKFTQDIARQLGLIE
ncbi:MAG: HNH endonuclease [Flavobacteriales bacterium]|nr:HNH endonuclease [Flavobacteriales bacterium]